MGRGTSSKASEVKFKARRGVRVAYGDGLEICGECVCKANSPCPNFQLEGAITTGYSELGQPYSGLAGAFVPLGSR